ncbi:hypothetical protein DLE01_28820, partial [Streptomyces sp. FT05W]
MAKFPAAAVAAGGLLGGYGIARWTRKRPLGGVALAAANLKAEAGIESRTLASWLTGIRNVGPRSPVS